MRKIFIAAAITLFSASFLHGGYYIRQSGKSIRMGKTTMVTSEIWMQGPDFRMENEKFVTIVNYRTNSAYFLQKKRKIYYKLTLQQLRQLMNAFVEMMKSMGGNFTPKVEITDEIRQIKGYRCRVVKMQMGNFQQIEQCLSSQVKIDPSTYFKTLTVILPDELLKAVKERQEAFMKLGFPVYSKTVTNMMGRQQVTETYLESYEEKNLPPNLFTVPEGYREKTFSFSFQRR